MVSVSIVYRIATGGYSWIWPFNLSYNAVDGCQSWKLAQILLQLVLESSASFRRWIPARVSGKCVMGIRLMA